MGILSTRKDMRFDEIGEWSEMKLDIVGMYAKAYTTILRGQPEGFKIYYIDGFSGPGLHKTKSHGELVDGSPLRVLDGPHKFNKYYLIEQNHAKAKFLQQKCKERFPDRIGDIQVIQDDCNQVLMNDILPKMAYGNYERVLCLLDPYGLHLDWQVIQKMGSGMGTRGIVDLILNFPVLDMNMNILLEDLDKASASQLAPMDRFWGDASWRNIAYTPNLFGGLEKTAKRGEKTYESIAIAYRDRLKKEAGFKFVREPLLMRTPEKNAPLYYLFFASANPVAHKVAGDVFNKYGK